MSQEILKKLRDEVRRRPSDGGAWHALGQAALEAGDRMEALAAFGQSVDHEPEQTERALSIAQTLIELGEIENAEHVIRRVMARTPELLEARVALAQALLARGEDALAGREVAAALAERPRDSALRMLAASIDSSRGDLARAADHLAVVLANDVDHLDANRSLGILLSELGDNTGALRCWRRVVAKTGRDDLEACSRLGIALANDGQQVEAVEILQEVAVRAGDSESHGNLGMALLGAGRVDEAAKVFSTALALDAESPQAHCGLGLTYMKRAQWKEAAQSFDKTFALAPEQPTGPLNLGIALEAMGDREGALRAFLRAAALAPDDTEIREALERFMAHTGEHPVAPPAAGGEADSSSMGGNLSSFPLLDTLEFLRVQRRTGALVLSSKRGSGFIRLMGGAVTSAGSPRAPRLGESLVAAGAVSPIEVQAALAEQRASSSRNEASCDQLGTLLLRDGVIDEATLRKHLRAQILSAVGELEGWREGVFSFHPSEESTAVTFDLQDVMLDVLRAADERVHHAGKSPVAASGSLEEKDDWLA